MPTCRPVLQEHVFVAVFRNLIPAPVSAVSRVPPAFDSCIAGKIYRYPVDLMIKQLKYQARLDTVRSLSRVFDRTDQA